MPKALQKYLLWDVLSFGCNKVLLFGYFFVPYCFDFFLFRIESLFHFLKIMLLPFISSWEPFTVIIFWQYIMLHCKETSFGENNKSKLLFRVSYKKQK